MLGSMRALPLCILCASLPYTASQSTSLDTTSHVSEDFLQELSADMDVLVQLILKDTLELMQEDLEGILREAVLHARSRIQQDLKVILDDALDDLNTAMGQLVNSTLNETHKFYDDTIASIVEDYTDFSGSVSAIEDATYHAYFLVSATREVVWNLLDHLKPLLEATPTPNPNIDGKTQQSCLFKSGL